MATTRVYTEITSSTLGCMRTWLTKNRVEMPTGDSGDITVRQGALGTIELHFDWNDQTDEFTINITDKPAYIPDDNVWKVFDKGITDCGGQTP